MNGGGSRDPDSHSSRDLVAAAWEGRVDDLDRILSAQNEAEKRRLLAVRADVECGDCRAWCVTPLVAASYRGHVTTTRLLLAKYRNFLDIEDTALVSLGETGYDVCKVTAGALWCAAGGPPGGEDELRLIQLLVDHGAGVNIRASDATTPLWSACARGRLSAAVWLLEHGADVTVTSRWGETCLMRAACLGDLDLVLTLIRAGCPLDVRDHQQGYTALHHAAAQGHVSTVRVLLSAGCAWCADGGVSPLHAAAAEGQTEAVNYLLKVTATTDRDAAVVRQLLDAGLVVQYGDCEQASSTTLSTSPGAGGLQAMTEEELALWGCLSGMDLAGDPERAVPCAARLAVLTMRRVLGRHHPRYAQALFWLGTLLGGSVCEEDLPQAHNSLGLGNYTEVVGLWIEALDILWKARHLAEASEVLLALATLVSSLSPTSGTFVSRDSLGNVVKRAMDTLFSQVHGWRGSENMYSTGKAALGIVSDVTNGDVMAIVLLLTECLKGSLGGSSTAEVNRLVRRLVKLDVQITVPMATSCTRHVTPLHVLCDPESPAWQQVALGYRSLGACVPLLERMLQAGADPNAEDSAGNTPLHALAGHQRSAGNDCDQGAIYRMAGLLLEHGAHTDWRNGSGLSAMALAGKGSALWRLLGELPMPRPLACLSAQVIAQHELPLYHLPVDLQKFAQRH